MRKSLYDYCIEHDNTALLEEWDSDKNGDLTPEALLAGSHKKVWWRCKQGHEWSAEIRTRALNEAGCPVCTRRKVKAGENDLATTHPNLATEWHPTKNGDLNPQDVLNGSTQAVWWQCEKGHEWKAEIYSRQHSGCPYCTGKKVLAGFNDLETLYPQIAEQWHPELNGGLRPNGVTAFSNRRVWWQCEKGHSWSAVVGERTKKGEGCPYCTNRRILVGFNDLATLYPLVAKQWHPTLNGELKPEMVTPGSKKKVWWKCQFGHEWKTVIYSRTNEKSRLAAPTAAGGLR